MAIATSTSPLLTAPLWRDVDLGKPLPESPHATSVAMPLWKHVVGYEEGDPAIVSKLQCGYPRFVVHPSVSRLFEWADERYAGPDERCFVFPSERVAEGCAAFLSEQDGVFAKVHSVDGSGLGVLAVPRPSFATAKRYWQHFGEIVSSRRAAAFLGGAAVGIARASDSKRTLRTMIASWTGQPEANVHLCASGMGAVALALRAVQRIRPGAKSVQLGFPYVDGYKVQHVQGPGVYFLPNGDSADLDRLEAILERDTPSAVFCEVPSNPLLRTPDLVRLRGILRPRGIPLAIDDTISTFAHVDLGAFADVVTSSLTKTVSGAGDVMAGSVVVSNASPLRDALQGAMRDEFEDLLWEEDARALAENARDFLERARAMAVTTDVLVDWLREQPGVGRIYYPRIEDRAHFDAVRRDSGGYGSLFSIVLEGGEATAAAFYDALRVCKGPSLGTNFSLACPYTLLAHYGELAWAESLGVSRSLVRISVGLEPLDRLQERFAHALAAANARFSG